MKDKIKLIISLLKLVRPFLMIMLLAIILGVLGHLTATFIPSSSVKSSFA